MLHRKKISDFYPNLKNTLSRETWIEEKFPDTEKYELVAWNSGNWEYGEGWVYCYYIRQTILNFSSNAKVLALQIDLLYGCPLIATIDFSNQNTADEFKQILPAVIKEKIFPVEQTILSNLRKQKKDYLPQAKPISFRIKLDKPFDGDLLIKTVDLILLAIHKIDPLDLRTIKILNHNFPIHSQTLKSFLQQEQEIREELKTAYAYGAAMGLFAKLGYAIELGHMVGPYINDTKTGANLGLVCKQTNEMGVAETERKAAVLQQKFSSR